MNPRELTCLRCNTEMVFGGTKRFHEGTTWNIHWVNLELLDLYYCPGCGKVELFVHTDEVDAPDSAKGFVSSADPINCLECGENIPADAQACPKCGWTWK